MRSVLDTQVVINTDQYRGSLAAPAVLRAICAGFAEGRCVGEQTSVACSARGSVLARQHRCCDVLHSNEGAASPNPRSEPPICLSGGLNVDDCASGTDTCWRGEGAGGQPLSACVDTFRGYVCRCPQGEGPHSLHAA